MAERKCRYCLYWHSRLPGGREPTDDTVGECRFGPPTFYAANEGPRVNQKRGAWPETYGRDWCGQFSVHRWPQPRGGFPRLPSVN
jgi:hypothetical protein